MLPVSISADFSSSLHSGSVPTSRPSSDAASCRPLSLVEHQDQAAAEFSFERHDDHRQHLVANGQLVADFFQRDLPDFIERDGDDPIGPAAHRRGSIVRGRGEQLLQPGQCLDVISIDFDHALLPLARRTGSLFGYDLDEAGDIEDQRDAAVAEDAGPGDSPHVVDSSRRST